MRRIPSSSLLVAVLLLLPFMVASTPVTTEARLGDAPPTVHPAVSSGAASLAADQRLDVVVTAWDQAGLAALDELGVAHRGLATLPIAFARLTSSQVDALAGDRRIRSLWPEERFDLFLDEGTAITGADRVQQDLGVDGTGVIVAVIDTGIDTTHPDLDGGKVLGNFEIVDSPFDDVVADLFVDSPDSDDHGHGTHVASTIAGLDDDGDNAMDGVAPGADLYGYSINVGASVLSSHAIVAFDDLVQRRQAGEPIVAASNSWGGSDGTYSPDDPLAVATRALVDHDILPVFAAGNSGPGLETASNQCTIPWTFCVGAITKGRTLAGFSSRGRTPTDSTEYRPTEDPSDETAGTPIAAGNHDVALGQALEVGVYRPNVSAPGVDIEAACAQAACGPTGSYQFMSGTSMATPHVSGVVALVQSARLAATDDAAGDLLTAQQVGALLEGTATPLPGYELWEVGTGEVDALAATSVARTSVAAAELEIPLANAGATTAEGGEASSKTFTGTVLPNGYQTGVGTYVEAFEVADDVAKGTALLTWDRPSDNIYLNLYAPGLTPGEDSPTAQSAGLLEGNLPYMRGYRDLEVHFPDPGTWHLEVVGRVNAPADVEVEITQQPMTRPDITLDQITTDQVTGTTDAGVIAAPGETGVTRAAVPGTAEPLAAAGEPTTYWLHSTAGAADGPADLFLNGEPLASFDDQEPATPVSKVSEVTMLANADYAGNFLTAYWRGQVSGALAGDVTLNAYLSSPTGTAFASSVTATLFATEEEVQGVAGATVLARTTAAVPVDPVPTEVEFTIPDVLTSDLTGKDVVLQLTSTYIDTGHVQVWHDSTVHPSSITFPVLDTEVAPLLAPDGVTATDGIGGGATIGWEPVDDAAGYVVERSFDPRFEEFESVSTTAASYEDTTAPVRSPAYYRVRSVDGDGEHSAASAIVHATPVDDTPYVEVQFGLGPWELAALDSDGSWIYERITGTEQSCTRPGNAPDRVDHPGKGEGGPEKCETVVTRGDLPTGDVQARASRWFTTSASVGRTRS